MSMSPPILHVDSSVKALAERTKRLSESQSGYGDMFSPVSDFGFNWRKLV